MQDIWPEHHKNEIGDAIEVEVHEPWLESSLIHSGHDYEESVLFDHTHSGTDCSHVHDHDHDDHSHDPGPAVEERSISLEAGPRPGKELYSALIDVLTRKDIITTIKFAKCQWLGECSIEVHMRRCR
jgi:hypothetical protein